MTPRVLPLLASHHLPSMYMRLSAAVAVAIPRLLKMEFYLAGLFYAEWLKGAKAYGEPREDGKSKNKESRNTGMETVSIPVFLLSLFLLFPSSRGSPYAFARLSRSE